MEVFCVTVEYEGVRPSDNYTSFTLWATLEGARRALKQERKDILKKPGWSEDTIEADENLFAELRRRGYNGELRYSRVITV